MRQLGHHTTGYLTWKGGINSAMTATIDRRTDKHHVTANLQVSHKMNDGKMEICLEQQNH